MSFEPVDLFLKDNTPQKNPVLNAVVKVLSQDGAIQWGQSVTDSSGHVGFLLPSESSPFQVRFFKFAVTFPNPQLITVLPSPLASGQSNVFDIEGQVMAPPVPLDARLCTAYGYFRDVTGAPSEGIDIHFVAKFDPVWLEGAGVLKERVSVRTDATGYVELNLIRNAQYDVTVQGEEDLTRHVAVPDLPNCNIVDLIFPIPASVTYAPLPPYTVAVGAELALTSTVLASDGENLGVGREDVFYQSDNTDVLAVQVSPVGITLVGVAPGTANLLVKRRDLSIVHIPDAGIQGQPIAVTVTS